MCGRFTLVADPASIAAEFGVAVGPEGTERYNIAPSQRILAIVTCSAGEMAARLLRWGLIPSWAKDEKVGYRMINARSETVGRSPAFRTLVRSSGHRCLIVADGFYEWMKPEDKRQPRQPVRYTLADGEPFAFAGLWTVWRPEGREPVASCTILTTEANALVRPVHDRMPVILRGPHSRAAWLDPEADGDAVADCLRPLSADAMRAQPASRLVNSVKNEGSELLEPAAG